MARPPVDRQSLIPQLGDIFRRHGYEGASLARITDGTGLGKGSLYNLFPGGKAEMLALVLEEITHWFEANVFTPLETLPAQDGLKTQFTACASYFWAGKRVCLVGALALDDSGDPFGEAIRGYFQRWLGALKTCLHRAGLPDEQAYELAQAVISGIQGGLVLSHALRDPTPFAMAMLDLEQRCHLAISQHN